MALTAFKKFINPKKTSYFHSIYGLHKMGNKSYRVMLSKNYIVNNGNSVYIQLNYQPMKGFEAKGELQSILDFFHLFIIH